MYFFIEKSCLLTDKIKKSSINTAPNGRMPAIRLLKGLQRNSVIVLHNLLLTCKQTSKQKVHNDLFSNNRLIRSSKQVTTNHVTGMQPH